jgi:serine/threonine protein phosphatase PrpC
MAMSWRSAMLDLSSEQGPEDTMHGPDAPADEERPLEEVLLPPTVQTLDPLEPGTVLGADGEIQVGDFVEARGRVNHYSALHTATAGEGMRVDLREGPIDHLELIRETEVLLDVQYSMLPRVYASFVSGERRYLATERFVGATLREAIDSDVKVSDAVSIVIQLTQVARRLQQAGWSLLALALDDVHVGQPLHLSRLSTCRRIGDIPSQPVFVAGYSAPEVANGTAVTGKESVYTLGAVLYRLLAKRLAPEEGADLAALSELVPIPGAPQVLAKALAPLPERADIQSFYESLANFRNSLGIRLGLQIANGTTIGLNPTRQLNEDACGFTSLTQAGAAGLVQSAVLCVVDGMGGMEAGEVASRAALDAVMKGALSSFIDGSERAVAPEKGRKTPRRLVQDAARAVVLAANGRNVGATITCVLVADGMLTLGHVGDTRAYLVREGSLTRLTRDHSLVATMVANGMLTPAEARGHPDSNKVLRSLGGQRELPDEYVDDLAVVRGSTDLAMCDGDWLLLCSDGVWGAVDDDLLCRMLLDAADCESGVHAILNGVLAAGAADNASVVLARCQATTWA